ncbi:hypothetical protein [Microbacterium dauci]|uniref:Luciferase-like domain-containing protein n=1 Tax=Microbacterium dauci TaxID=3048008 RepID=A0ABT6ZCD0_9MICO|nr:hypothetical protein [Microbacterium sp. LX3-4]MDJ1113814.1 hypothetical protein [Microbacterium sp. LX3-4]
MRVTFSLFPWDVDGDPNAAAWLAEHEVTDVALAATYHAARAATPRHPAHQIVHLDHSASYLDGPAPLPRGRFSFERARDDLTVAGVRVSAWVVLSHLEGARRDIPRVIDAFGTESRHALCVRSPEALEFAVETVRSVARAGCDRLIVEGASWSNLGHASLHDKIAAADLNTRALSWCLCQRCASAADVDPGRVRAALHRREPVPADAAERVRLARRDAADGLRAHVLHTARASGIADVLFHPDPDEPSPHGRTLVDAWHDTSAAVAQFRDSTADAAYVNILNDPAPSAIDLGTRWSALRAAGANELLVYHAGLASTSRLDAALTAMKGIS